MKKVEDVVSTILGVIFCCLLLAGFTFTTIGWVLWSAKWVLGLLGVI